MIGFLTQLGQLVEALPAGIPTAAALFARLSLLILLLPAIGENFLPMRVRIVLTVTLAALLLPLVAPVEGGVGVPLIVSEAFIGLFLGFSIRIFTWALGLTGAVIAQALSLSQAFGFATEGDSSSLLTSVLTLTASVLFLTADLEVAAIRVFFDSFISVPLGSALDLDVGSIADLATSLGAEGLRLGLILSMPFLVLNFAYYLILGFLNRAMPQLMITFVGLPAITWSGLVLLMIAIVPMLTFWLTKVTQALAP